jgi:hypothetical protein
MPAALHKEKQNERTMRQPKDNNLPFQLIHRFINFVKLTHRSEYARKHSKVLFSDNELVIILHLEQAATDLRRAKPKLISQAKQIISESSFVPVSECKRYLLACIELLLIEAKARQKNPAIYDALYQGTLWYFHNRGELPKEVVKEIELYLAFGKPYESPEEAQKEDELFEKIIAYSEKRPLSVEAFIREKVWQLQDPERNNFLYSRKVKDWITNWHAEYCKVHKYVSMDTFENIVYKVRKEERKKEDKKRGIEEEELKKNQNGR